MTKDMETSVKVMVAPGVRPLPARQGDMFEAVSRLAASESGPQVLLQLVQAAEFRNAGGDGHIERVSRYCEVLARRLGLDGQQCDQIRIASTLHDIGKIGISSAVLLKPGKLVPAERRIIERHPEIGQRMLAGSRSELLELAATIAWTHHERFDGTGYPRRLAGEAIPIEGRIASVADVFDALTSERVYRPALPLPRVLKIMRRGCGGQFDASILELFLDSLSEILAIQTDSRLATVSGLTPLRARLESVGETQLEALISDAELELRLGDGEPSPTRHRASGGRAASRSGRRRRPFDIGATGGNGRKRDRRENGSNKPIRPAKLAGLETAQGMRRPFSDVLSRF
jgi:hypothetical protein